MPILKAYMVPHPPMIVPAVGRGSEKRVEETTRAYERVAEEIAELAPDTIIFTSPHSIMYADYFHLSPGKHATGDFSRFGAPQVSFSEQYDSELVYRICDIAAKNEFDAGTLGEKDPELDHGVLVPLYFIRKVYNGGKIIRVSLSGLPYTEHYKLGMMIREAVDSLGRKAVFVASGDLSHKLKDYGPYGFAPEGPQYDEKLMDVMERCAFKELLEFDERFCDLAAECGHRSFVIMSGALDGKQVESEVLSHQDVTGVGYGVAGFSIGAEDKSRCFLTAYMEGQIADLKQKYSDADSYVRLAKMSIDSYIRGRAVLPLPQNLPKEMLAHRAGAFVSIHKQGRLRGCIGTTEPTRASVAEEIIHNAISASTADPRFTPITADELDLLEINVDVLAAPEPIVSKDELDVKRYGVIVSCGRKRGLLLPDLDGVDTVDQQISIAMQKGRISPEEDYKLQRFEVIRHT